MRGGIGFEKKNPFSGLGVFDPQGQTLKTEDEFPYMPIFFRDWGCQMDPENQENLDVDSEEDLRNDAMYNITLDKWQR